MVSRDQFDKEVQNIVRQLVRLYKPQKVVLFGSLAKGKISQGTDIDLFIVKKALIRKSWLIQKDTAPCCRLKAPNPKDLDRNNLKIHQLFWS
jgi:predicted nucleotidyltransferase